MILLKKRKGQTNFEYLLLAGFAVLAVVIVISVVRSQIFPSAVNEGNNSAATTKDFLNQANASGGGSALTLGVQLLSPADGASQAAGLIAFGYMPKNFTSLSKATLYSNFSGAWEANQTVYAVSFQTNYFHETLPAGNYSWNVEVCDNSPTPRCASAPSSYSIEIT